MPGLQARETSIMGTLAREKMHCPAEAVTTGPKHHFFGYYDKFQFDPSDRHALGMEVDFIDIRVRMIDCATSGIVSSVPSAAAAAASGA